MEQTFFTLLGLCLVFVGLAALMEHFDSRSNTILFGFFMGVFLFVAVLLCLGMVFVGGTWLVEVTTSGISAGAVT